MTGVRSWLRRKPMSGPLGDARRAALLLLFGFAHIVYGFGYFSTDRADTHTLVEALVILAGWVGVGVTLPIAGALWVGTGTCAVLAAFIPPGRDSWGFKVLISIDSAWSMLYLLGWVFGFNSRGWAQAVLFSVFAGVLAITSGMVSAANVRKIQEAGAA